MSLVRMTGRTWFRLALGAAVLTLVVTLLMRPAGSPETEQPTPGVPVAETVTLHVIQNKVEVADVFARMAAAYETEHPGVRMQVETFGGGIDFASRLSTLIQAGDAPDVFTNDGYALLDPWIQYAADLSDQPWVQDMLPGSADPVTRDGHIYGMPESIEGFGFAANQALMREAGILAMPDTFAELTYACEKLEDAGITPFANSYAEWWVLGNHNMNLPLAAQDEPQAFIDGIISGSTRFSSGKSLDGWLRLLRFTYDHGQPNSVTEGDYATSVAMFASGQAAMIQQGNWIQPALDKVDPDMDLTFVPMPIGDGPDGRIYAGVTNFFIVNADTGNADAAKEWLNWLWSSETGHRYMTDELKYVPCFRSIPTGTLRGLNAALSEHVAAGTIHSWDYPRLPSGSALHIGSALSDWLTQRKTTEQMYDAINQAIRESAARADKLSGGPANSTVESGHQNSTTGR